LDNITVRLRNRWLLERTNWRIGRGDHWVVWGPNGAGKSTLVQVLTGQAVVVQGAVQRHYEDDPTLCGGRPALALVSSEQYHRLYQRERMLGHMRYFSGRVQDATLAGDLFDSDLPGDRPADRRRREHIQEVLQLSPLLAKPLTVLSSGEMRKVLLGRALLVNPCLLILDEPYNGLDAASREQLEGLLAWLSANDTQIVLITHRLSEIPMGVDHVLQLEGGRAIWQGRKAAFIERLAQPATDPRTVRALQPLARQEKTAPAEPPLIAMRAVTVRFGDQVVLDRIAWTMHADEHWALTGPNGAGKSTLLALITGDQLQAYANDISVFGRRKGSGESVWEIKQQIGYVGDALQARYQRQMSGFDVICSGFFDSVGLYRRCTPDQRRTARQWVQSLAMEEIAGQPMARLSFGQQRLVLIARAVVKTPRLLILDEPCNGLDGAYRRRVLEMLARISRISATQLLYVSHRPDEMPACITHRLRLESGRVAAVDHFEGQAPSAGAKR
jgi:molybdate transport system ATP-binding protein